MFGTLGCGRWLFSDDHPERSPATAVGVDQRTFRFRDPLAVLPPPFDSLGKIPTLDYGETRSLEKLHVQSTDRK